MDKLKLQKGNIGYNIIMECINCFCKVSQARIDAGYNYCINCAEHVQKLKGIMCFDHKTAGEMQAVTPEQFSEHRKYNPYGKNTGRGSGLHRVLSRADK